MISKEKISELFEKAKDASKYSYSPYSKYPVGAAVLTSSGSIYQGTNVENASLGLTICAERVAIYNSIVNGQKDIVAVAVYAKNGDVSPCGACRQVISEFGKDTFIIYMNEGKLKLQKIEELLPAFFLKEELE